MQNICFDFVYYYLSIDVISDTKREGRKIYKRELTV